MSASKIMITGVHGFVGARAMQHYPHAIPVPGELLRTPGENLKDFIKAHHPDVILNAAAVSDIGACQRDPEASHTANVKLPVALAEVCARIGAKLISFSSDQVYTGCTHEGPYSERDVLPIPANTYACHKLEAEERVLDISPDAVLLRATWMYDMPIYGGENALAWANRGNFLVNTVKTVLEGKALQASMSEHRGITYVRQVIGLLDEVMHIPGGVYNYGSENPLCMEDTVKEFLRVFGLSAEVTPTDRRAHNLWMDCTKLRDVGICFDTTAEGFARCAKDYAIM